MRPSTAGRSRGSGSQVRSGGPRPVDTSSGTEMGLVRPSVESSTVLVFTLTAVDPDRITRSRPSPVGIVSLEVRSLVGEVASTGVTLPVFPDFLDPCQPGAGWADPCRDGVPPSPSPTPPSAPNPVPGHGRITGVLPSRPLGVPPIHVCSQACRDSLICTPLPLSRLVDPTSPPLPHGSSGLPDRLDRSSLGAPL